MNLKNKFDIGAFVFLAEVEPPKGVNISAMVNHAMHVRKEIDAFVITEMSNAVMRMSALGGAMILQSHGVQTVMQINCRDRNRIALQADLLAAYGCGVLNVMAVSGEDPSLGDHHLTRAVYDIGLDELIQTIAHLCRGVDMAGGQLNGAPDFLVGASVNVGLSGDDLKRQVDRVAQQIENGVDFFITSPVFDLAAVDPFFKAIDCRKVKIVPTTLVLKSVGMARYIERHLPHVHIPPALIQRLQRSGDKERESLNIAAEIIENFKTAQLAGVMISTMGWEDKLPRLFARL